MEDLVPQINVGCNGLLVTRYVDSLLIMNMHQVDCIKKKFLNELPIMGPDRNNQGTHNYKHNFLLYLRS